MTATNPSSTNSNDDMLISNRGSNNQRSSAQAPTTYLSTEDEAQLEAVMISRLDDQITSVEEKALMQKLDDDIVASEEKYLFSKLRFIIDYSELKEARVDIG